MNSKQFSLILVVGLVLAGLAFWALNRNQQGWQSDERQIGQKVLPDFDVNSVTQITIKDSTNEVNLVKSDDLWKVEQRNGYPANFGDIAEFVRKMAELKVIQSQAIGESQLGRLNLLEPGKGDKAGVLVDFKDKDGKEVASLIVGKEHMSQASAAGGMGGGGWPDGRYLLVKNQPKSAILVDDTLSRVQTSGERWLDKDFFKIAKIRSVSLTHPEEGESWTLRRSEATGTMSLENASPEENFDTSKAASAANVLSSPSFTDVLVGEKLGADTGLDEGLAATIETFEGFTYTVKIGEDNGSSSYPLQVDVAATLQKERVAGEDEKEEDKARLDKEFQDQLKTLEEKLAKEKKLKGWTFLVSKWTIDPLLKKRSELMLAPKSEEDSTGTSSEPPFPGPFNPSLPQGIPSLPDSSAIDLDPLAIPPVPPKVIEIPEASPANPIKEATEKALENLKEGAESAAQKVEESVNKITEEAPEVIESIQSEVDSKVDEAIKALEGIAEEVSEDVKDVVEDPQ